ncbi:efflux RND transporter periplasmic adaptor subunit [Haloferula sp. A504]|uniref:efflux RND transporter periplasmic adaptor subunit n=1 Tax=Haloferula sp. A504 TaxID=3373601 RepID=UPI0031BE1FAA|nr:efflux RND transporter periplasmic adaptor subunit [Verrucomicrobiaceae bacterium E54]
MNQSLKSLARVEDPSKNRRALPPWTIPAALALGFSLLFAVLFRDRILPAAEVEVALVRATSSDSSSVEEVAGVDSPKAWDSPLAFQASGWVEPDPLPIKATALVDGVVEKVHVLEGDPVKQGQQLVTLIDDDARLALQAAQEALRTRKAELVEHRKSIEAGRRSVAAAEARAEAAMALHSETADRLSRIEGLAEGSISETERVKVRAAHLKARAGEAEALAAVEQQKAEVQRLEARILVLESVVNAAEVEVEQAELALARTEIDSPVDGRVLRLLSAPGQKKMLAMDDMDSATVAILYDPAQLQVRVDVPLADAAGLQIGQRTRIRCSLLPDTIFHGEVTRITGEANIQRNTLQAKVRIEDPSDQLRPEMLCRVEFLEVSQVGATAAPGVVLVTWIPEAALAGDAVWVCDPESKRVERRMVAPTDETKDGHVRIDRGLRPGEWVVLDPKDLSNGQRVNPELIQP